METRKYTIAICDIVGFKKIVEDNTLDKIVNYFKCRLTNALYHSIHKKDPPNKLITLSDLRNQSKIGITWFSDTVIMYTLKDDNENLEELISAVGWLLYYSTTPTEWQFRCGISYGYAHIDIDNEIFIGQPIIDAHLLQENQKWYGGALTEEAEKRVGPSNIDSEYQTSWPLVTYNVPLKKREIPSNVAINWTVFHSKTESFGLWDSKFSKKTEDPSPLDWIHYYDICEKFTLTKEFYKKFNPLYKGIMP
jgi:hypothetical protein